MNARSYDAPSVEKGPDAGNAVGPVVNSWAERGGQRRHVFGGEGGEREAKGFLEGVKGAGDGKPLCLSGEGGCMEVVVNYGSVSGYRGVFTVRWWRKVTGGWGDSRWALHLLTLLRKDCLLSG